MRKALIVILLCVLVVLNIVFGYAALAYATHGNLPESISYTGYYIPVGFSINRMEDGFYVVALHWRSDTIAIERDGLHRYGG